MRRRLYKHVLDTEYILQRIQQHDYLLVGRTLSSFRSAHTSSTAADTGYVTLSSPTACVTHLVAPTGTQADFFTSWSCGEAPATTTILQTTKRGADISKARATTTGAAGGAGGSSPVGSGSGSSNGGGSDAANSEPGQSAAGGASSSIINAGIIAAIVLGAILVLSIAGWVIWKCRKRQKDAEEMVRRHAAYTKNFEMQEPGGNSEALMGSDQTARWVWKQGMDDRMTVAG